MKILNIYFKNINSLAGENRIHFDRAPIADGGVFAITGDNGSGKSSILDVITLALYGETFRFDQPADHVMTKSTAESFAVIEFSLGTKVFRSSWHITRKNGKPKNELLPAEMKLLQINDEEKLIESSPSKVRDKIATLTGLDFHKFSKSIVLAQGDFASFLNALDNERMDILEKICKTDIYADYKKGAKEKFTSAQTQLQHLEQDLSAIPIMDAETIVAKKEDLQDFQEYLLALENKLTTTLDQLDWVKKISALEEQEQSLTDKLNQVKNQYQENQQNLSRINNVENTSLIEEEIATIDRKTEEFKQNKTTLDSYRIEVETLQKELSAQGFDKNSQAPATTPSQQKQNIDQSQLKFSDLESSLLTEKTSLNSLNQQLEEHESILLSTNHWLKEHEHDEKLINNFPDIEASQHLTEELSELSKKRKTYTKWSKNTTSTSKNNKSKITDLEKQNNELKQLIIEKEKSLQDIAEGRSVEDLHHLRTEQQERINDFQELYALAGVNTKLGKKNVFGKFFGSFNKIEGDEFQLQKEADQLQLKIAKEQNIINTLEFAITNENLLKKMETDRVHLLDGKACPLCGALDHPFSKHPPAVSNSQQALTDQQKKIKELTTTSSNLNKKITTAKKEKEKKEGKETHLQNVRSQWSTLSNKLNTAATDINIGNPSSIKELLKEEKQELSNITQLIKQYGKQQNAIKKTELSIQNNETIFNRLTQETEKLDSDWNNRPQESIELERTHAQCLEQEKALSKKIEKQLELLGEKMPSKKNKATFIEQLKQRKQEFQKNKIRQKSLVDEIKQFKTQIPLCTSKIDNINQDIKLSSANVKKEEVAGLHLSLIEKQKLLTEQSAIFIKQEAEVTALNQSLMEKNSDPEYKNIGKLKEIITLSKQQPEIEQAGLNLKQNIEQTQTDLQQINTQLQTEKAEQITQSSESELLAQKKSIHEKIDISSHEVNSLKSKLDKQDDLLGRHEVIQAKIVDQKMAIENHESEQKMMADENSIEFRQKVQSTMADNLLSHTNQILEKISGRYYVRKGKSDRGLSLEIEDTKQQNAHRLPKTLSGGESFVISLSLALGLAEIANNGQSIDSFFLDEGFGNLDAESLYLVMTTLENLKTKGKLVGVISHVEGVRKRIKTQIKMAKKPNGFSTLKVIS